MFRHILCPTDLKERAFIASKKAVQIAHPFNSKVTILNVHPEFMGRQDWKMLRVSFDGLKEKYRRVALESREEKKTERTPITRYRLSTKIGYFRNSQQ